MSRDRQILRELASRYLEIAKSNVNYANIIQHKRVNDLKSERPIVLIDEIPWGEMNLDHELDLQCENGFCRDLEWFFREKLFRAKHFPCDTVFQPFFPAGKVIRTSGIGIQRLEKEGQEHAFSHTYVNQIRDEKDLEKLHNDRIALDADMAKKVYETIGDYFGDILPVKMVGWETGYGLGLKTLDDVVNFCGLDTFFYDLVERPKFIHQMIRKLTDIFLDTIAQLEEMDLLEENAYYCHSTAGLSDDFAPSNGKVTRKQVWGRGLAQIFASVSPQMHEEFDIAYVREALAGFGLVYYGCCEPLDKKIGILETIPNLRKISISPWADVNNACAQIGRRYVVSVKPNPATLAVEHLNEQAVTQEIRTIGEAIRRNNCSAELVLKDITTVKGNPYNLIQWHDIACRTLQEIFQ